MEIKNVKVNDLAESIVACKYPMVADMYEYFATYTDGGEIERAKQLANAGGGGHDQFLSGITVSFDLTCTNKMWVEVERYRFITFVSSQSTMHRISKMDIGKACNEYVDKNIIKRVNKLKEIYLKTLDSEDYLKLLYNIPSGFELTARLTTNYRCLKNVYWQRKNHRLKEWRDFCKWIETLPRAKDFIICED